MAIAPANRDGADRLSKALQRFRREDPTLHVSADEETSETIIAGMGELHLEIYVERIRREYNVEVEVGAPKVNYREAPTQAAEFNTRHNKQTGGSGPIRPHRRPARRAARRRHRELRLRGKRDRRADPKQFIPAVEKGFRCCYARARWPATRWSACRSRSKTAHTTRSTAPTWRFRLAPGLRCARTFPKTAGAAGAGDEDRDRVP